MSRPWLLVALFLAATPTLATASGEFTSPSPNLLYQMQNQNSSQPRLWVRSNSTLLDLHVLTLDEEGLKGVRPHSKSDVAPPVIRWSSVERIDEVVTGRPRGQWIGGILGVAGGLILGNLIGSSIGSGGGDALIGAVALGGVGFWYGGRIGERHVHEEPWYVAERSSVPDSGHAAGQPVLRVSDLLPPRVVSTPFLSRPHGLPATAPPLGASREDVLRACDRIDANDLIRMRGDFGYFQGHAGVVGPGGFEGLRNSAPRPIGPDASLELVTWDRIRSVDKRGSAWKRGALISGLTLGALGAYAGAVIGSTSEDNTYAAAAGGAAYGAVVVGGIGAVLGAGIGSMFPAWHNVYRAR